MLKLFVNNGNKIGYWQAHVEGAEVIIEYAKDLDGKAVRKVYKAKPKNVGRSNETTAEEQAELEMQSRCRKKIKEGYVNSIREATLPVTNQLGLKFPMTAGKYSPKSKVDWSTAMIQPKLDGHRAMYCDGVLYSRDGDEIDLTHIEEDFEALFKRYPHLEGTHFDGELYCHGKTLEEIGSLIKRPREESKGASFHIYDVVSDEEWLDRVDPVIEALEDSRIRSLRFVDTYTVDSDETVKYYHKHFLDLGYEGSMIRTGTKGYEDNKRSNSLLKVKDFDDAEFRVVDFEEGKAYHATDGNVYRVPVWVCDAGNSDGKTFTVTAQGTMQEKNKQWLKADEYIGKLLTVQFFGKTADKIPKLPVALRWREDI